MTTTLKEALEINADTGNAMPLDREDIKKLSGICTAADALFAASEDASKFFAKHVADTESVIGQRALDRLEKAMRKYREVSGG